ncbi:MAG: four helix bundle protein [Flavobacteriia bacterium]|nr:four helix bundle protein [Flavobacteriia bacterium]OIP46450.1 MAG: four helix bundle protein [Flavobacteriaceae bacterium CG2_30_31_66]PIV96559.1 MAG: four helix bundle protein [Flavobacteriaceae bacterium CG17_big_fil_post_rev_8_21_14_2_50_31_13]PIX10953.1 MAG: four helix bundle protein [Flavobacteriaceae bacterium CG_4_8_14_3_um_filter_31_8]PIY16081.1 MAG: four helix bundle protein [Flavobacteriaceae bacterium CG_4_10_14_3_um_filter_31_253]PIZ09930.1 MAG: four helix bundle protein [Flavo
MKESIVQKKSFQFSLNIISLYKNLQVEKEFIISRQLLRCGTSIGANIEEALAGQSKKDFASKMAISSKEARETKYWLRLLKESELSELNVDSLILEIDELIRILTSIVKTSQLNISESKTKN